MFVMTVSLAAHLLVSLYARWTAGAAVRDAVHDAASHAAIDAQAVLPEIEADLRKQLGEHGSEWELSWSITDDRIALSADGPGLALWGTQRLHVSETAILEPTLSGTGPGSP